MEYVEVHPAGNGFQIVFDPPREDAGPYISNAIFVDPLLVELGVRKIGPWEIRDSENGSQYQRALVLG